MAQSAECRRQPPFRLIPPPAGFMNFHRCPVAQTVTCGGFRESEADMYVKLWLKWFWGAVFGAMMLSAGATESPGPAPMVFCADLSALAAAKTGLVRHDASFQPAFRQLIDEADRALQLKPLSVMDKRQIPPSGDKHDFISQAPYYWRDTNSPEGKYVRRDGERNPESGQDSDSGRFQKLCATVHKLGLAYYLSGEEKYAAKAGELTRVWFLNPATRMNPNFNYGQGIPGETEGRPTGLISARGLVRLVDGIGLLAGSKSWLAADQQGMLDWANRYLVWLTTSKIGRGEGAAQNNHGTYYDTQVVSLALFTGHRELAQKILLEAREKRIARPIEPDGREPLELARTLSFNYSLFNLNALLDLATLSQNVGVDLWHYQTADGRSILKAAEFLGKYADSGQKWPFQQIHPITRGSFSEALLRAAAQYPQSNLKDELKFFSAADLAKEVSRLSFKTADVPSVSGRSKPASQGRIKTSQFEEIIIGQRSRKNGTLTGEPTQIEPATIDLNITSGGMVQPGHRTGA